ncbi:hypothetical protein TUM4442_04100 [Shewanella algae]|nr:hypothetical protein TUM3811_38680 [Shewanella algae]BCV30883.1 hypothetical protein TUM4442_04100 [Shewanella algae]BCV39151.1 hypothetical protein TUM17378_04130 [Shewanella algae]BCV47733.1 hypothetical protein TUM17382_04260 [Shewanella algae]BCV52177.1 hypothetical protein TUM17383_04240 [Shewanella algae]
MLPFYRYLGTLPQTDTHNQIAAVRRHGDGYPVLPKVLSFGFVDQIWLRLGTTHPHAQWKMTRDETEIKRME